MIFRQDGGGSDGCGAGLTSTVTPRYDVELRKRRLEVLIAFMEKRARSLAIKA